MLVRIIRTEGVTGAFKGFSANMINTFSQRKSIVTYTWKVRQEEGLQIPLPNP